MKPKEFVREASMVASIVINLNGSTTQQSIKITLQNDMVSKIDVNIYYLFNKYYLDKFPMSGEFFWPIHWTDTIGRVIKDEA